MYRIAVNTQVHQKMVRTISHDRQRVRDNIYCRKRPTLALEQASAERTNILSGQYHTVQNTYVGVLFQTTCAKEKCRQEYTASTLLDIHAFVSFER
jgi:hypothetical protein